MKLWKILVTQFANIPVKNLDVRSSRNGDWRLLNEFLN